MGKKNTLGEVDLFGFDDFGGLGSHPALVGVAVGGGASVVAGMIVRRVASNPSVLKYSEGIGFLVGAAAGGVLWMKGDKEAGIVAIVSAAIASGLRQLENLFGSKTGLSAPVIDYLNGGMGVPQLEYLNGGLGIPTIGPAAPAYGTIPGVAGPALGDGSFPVDLLQSGTLPGAGNDAVLLGTPQPHGMGASYGATLFGSR